MSAWCHASDLFLAPRAGRDVPACWHWSRCSFIQSRWHHSLSWHVRMLATNVLTRFFCSSPANSTSSDDDVQDRSLLDTVLLAQWEDRFERGLFRYDVTACPTKVRSMFSAYSTSSITLVPPATSLESAASLVAIRYRLPILGSLLPWWPFYAPRLTPSQVLDGVYGFVAQLNEGRATKKRPTEFNIDRVLQARGACPFARDLALSFCGSLCLPARNLKGEGFARTHCRISAVQELHAFPASLRP